MKFGEGQGPLLQGKSSDWGLQPRHHEWVAQFRADHGRAPRVLHIGNIANNGYRNAVALEQAGVESHVLCYDYWHIMGCPEWEAAHFSWEGLDDFVPQWSKVDLGGHERPAWFAQGRLGTCLDYLISLCEGGSEGDLAALRDKMRAERDCGGLQEPSNIFFQPTPAALQALAAERAAVQYALTFPKRRDQLTPQEVLLNGSYFLHELSRITRLLQHYDGVIGYSTDGAMPLLAGSRNYVSYEHGTLRLIPFDRTYQGRMCALSYALATDVLITNCDNINAARRLNLGSFRFTPHAILEEWRNAPEHAALRVKLMADHDADFIVFHPSRQHWQKERNLNFEKANDVLIEAFARLVKTRRPKALLIMVEWGQTVAESKALIDELGIAQRVVWIRPMPVRMMQEYVAAADVLADQFAIGAWGGIMPIGLMLGTPVLIYLNEDLHSWAFTEMPPIFNVRTVDEVVAALEELLDPERAAERRAVCRQWYDRYHSLSVVAGRLMDSVLTLQSNPDEFARHEFDEEMVGLGLRLDEQMVGLGVHLSRMISYYGEPIAQLADRFEGGKIPGDAETLARYGPDEVVCYEFWSNAGASIHDVPDGRRVTTPASAWHYAAGVNLDLSKIDFEHEHCWVRVYLRDVEGEIRLALYDGEANAIGDELPVQNEEGIFPVVLKVFKASETLLMFRTSEEDKAAAATFVRAELITALSYIQRWRPDHRRG